MAMDQSEIKLIEACVEVEVEYEHGKKWYQRRFWAYVFQKFILGEYEYNISNSTVSLASKITKDTVS